MRPSIIGEPKLYCGSDIVKVYYSNSSCAWTMESKSYMKETINNVKNQQEEGNLRFNKKLSGVSYSPQNPFSTV